MLTVGVCTSFYLSPPTLFSRRRKDQRNIVEYLLVPRASSVSDFLFFFSCLFQVLRCLPGVRGEDIQQHGGLPCEGYPSDHLSIAVDLAPSSASSSSSIPSS